MAQARVIIMVCDPGSAFRHGRTTTTITAIIQALL
jgi:hypothetical protein